MANNIIPPFSLAAVYDKSLISQKIHLRIKFINDVYW